MNWLQQEAVASRKHSLIAKISTLMVESASTYFPKCSKWFPWSSRKISSITPWQFKLSKESFMFTLIVPTWGGLQEIWRWGDMHWGGDITLIGHLLYQQKSVQYPPKFSSPIKHNDSEKTQGQHTCQKLSSGNNK